MDQTIALEVGRQGIQVALMVALPVLCVSLFLGVMISVFQAVTQVQEPTLSFVPKVVGVAIVLTLMGGWMLSTLVSFTLMCFEQAARIGQ
jgi:flagellar biosynthesis protein FliQ